MIEKPHVLSDKELEEMDKRLGEDFYKADDNESWLIDRRNIAQAQRDDTWQKAKEYYEPLIKDLHEALMITLKKLDNGFANKNLSIKTMISKALSKANGKEQNERHSS